jgi:phospholipase/carboxylesterase
VYTVPFQGGLGGIIRKLRSPPITPVIDISWTSNVDSKLVKLCSDPQSEVFLLFSLRFATGTPQSILILLHGWGANAQDLYPLASVLALPRTLCLFPNAPFDHPQAPGGKAWYRLEEPDPEGLAESRRRLGQWLLDLETETGIPLAQTVLAGFSQGGAMSLDLGQDLPLAGVACLSGYLHFQPQTRPGPPILWLHGRQDAVVSIDEARRGKEELLAAGAEVEYQEFEGGHEIPPFAIERLREFTLAKIA